MIFAIPKSTILVDDRREPSPASSVKKSRMISSAVGGRLLASTQTSSASTAEEFDDEPRDPRLNDHVGDLRDVGVPDLRLDLAFRQEPLSDMLVGHASVQCSANDDVMEQDKRTDDHAEANDSDEIHFLGTLWFSRLFFVVRSCLRIVIGQCGRERW